MTRPASGRVLFLSDSHAGFTGNAAHLRDAMQAADPAVQVVGVFKAGLRAKRPLRDALRLPFLIASSPVIVLDDFYPLIYPMRLRSGTRLVQVWHAAGAFKRVGHSRAGLPGGPVPGSDIHRSYTDVFVSSEQIRGDYAEAFGVDLTAVKALGMPRSDFFFDDEALATARARVRSRYGVATDERLAVFAPTFRGNGQLTAFADATADWSDVARDLGPGWRVAVRHHPFATLRGATVPVGTIDAAQVEMNDLLAAADVLITDYSSAIFEFALLRRPIVSFVPDLAEYERARSFYRPFEHYAVGPVVADPAQLADAIRAATVDDARLDDFLAEFCGALDGHSSARIARDLLRAPHPAGRRSARSRSLRLTLSVIAAHVARVSLAIVARVLVVIPRRAKITMITREHRRPPLDFVLLEQAIGRLDNSVEVVMIARMVPRGLVRKIGYAFTLLSELFHVASSRVLVVDGYSIVASAVPHGDGLTIVQIWHALGALKKFGLSILDRPEGRDPRLARAMRMHSNYDVVIASAERCREPFAEALGVEPSQVVVAPLPRVDHLQDENARARARERFATMYPELDGREIAVFAPTFRAHGTEPTIDPVELTAALAERDVATITKLHPIMPAANHPALRTAPGMSTQDLLLVADLLVTDYSSAVFEAAVAGVPGYLLAPDLDDYNHARSFYLDYPRDLGLPFARSIDELVGILGAEPPSARSMDALTKEFVDMEMAGSAARTLAEEVLRHIR